MGCRRLADGFAPAIQCNRIFRGLQIKKIKYDIPSEKLFISNFVTDLYPYLHEQKLCMYRFSVADIFSLLYS